MEEARKISCGSNENSIGVTQVGFQIGDQASEILFLRTVIEGEDDEAGGDKEDEEKEFEPQKPSYRVPLHLHTIEGEIEGDQEERKEIDEVPGGHKVGDVEKFAEKIEPCNRKKKYSQKNEGSPFILRKERKEDE